MKVNNEAVNSVVSDRWSGTRGFSFLEVLTALAILGLVSSSVLLVINRCMASAADSALRMEAFLLARENLERVLIRDSVEEWVEYGTSDKSPGISWQTVIEAFPEPVGGEMWVRAVCSAEYGDSKGETRRVELIHWIAKLTEQQAGQILQEEDMARLELEQVLPSMEEAAVYAGVDVQTLEEWVENGLLGTPDGEFLKYNLDLFMENKGNLTDEQKARQMESVMELAMALRTLQKEWEHAVEAAPNAGRAVDPTTGLTYEQLLSMSVGEVVELLKQRRN
jgi:prepilin-type N-terminal cleavage/methylation domain-containing protein